MRKKSILLALVLFLALVLISCRDTRILKPIGSVRTGIGYSIDIKDQFVYISGNDGFSIVNVQNPEKPVRVGKFLADTSFGLRVNGDLVYLASSQNLIIVDVNDPSNPSEVGHYQINGIANTVEAGSNYAYLGASTGLYIFDVVNPVSPILLAAYGEGKEVRDIVLNGDLLYVGFPDRGVQVIDISNPAVPDLIATIPDTGGVQGVYIGDKYIFAACHQRGIKIANVENIYNPQIVGSYLDNDGGEALAVWGKGNILFVADNFNIEVLNIEDPVRPVEIGTYSRVSAAHDLVGDQSLIFIPHTRLLVLEFEGDL